MGDLKPLDDSLLPAQRELASNLRVLFEGLGVTLIRYAARVHLDKGQLSRYLSGKAIPPWEFIHRLLIEVAHTRDDEVAQVEVVAHLKALHQAAMAASGTPAHRSLLLQEALAEADRVAQRAVRRERELEQALDDARLRISELSVERNELEARDGEAAQRHASELSLYDSLVGDLRDERTGLLEEIARLQSELAIAHRRRLDAEQRCEELERQLESGPIPDGTAEPGADGPDASNASERPAYARAADRVLRAYAEAAVEEFPAEPATAGALLDQLDAGMVSGRLDLMDPLEAAALLDAMDYRRAAIVASRMRAGWAAEALKAVRRLPPGDLRRAAPVLNWIDPGTVAEAFATTPVPDVVVYLQNMHPARAVHVLTLLDTPLAVECMVRLGKPIVLAALEVLPPVTAAEALTRMYAGEASELVDQLKSPRAAEILRAMEVHQAVAILGLSSTASVRAILAEMVEERMEEFLQAFPPERREILRPQPQNSDDSWP